MKGLICAAALVLGLTNMAFAGELDNESSVTNQSMNGTVIIRVDQRTNQMAVLTSEQTVNNNTEAQNLAHNGSFQNVSSDHIRSELDQDGGASSWYFYRGYNSYAYMNWYGSWYRPCYSYNYNYYSYYYYSNYWW